MAEWTVENIVHADAGRLPSAEQTVQLIHTFHATWMVAGGVDLPDVGGHLFAKLRLSSPFSWTDFRAALEPLQQSLKKLYFCVQYHKLDDPDAKQELQELTDLLYSLHDLFKHSTRVLRNLDPGSISVGTALPPADDEDAYDMDLENESVLRHDPNRLTSFQRLVCYIREVLQERRYKRVREEFFSRITLPNKCSTLAFKKEISVNDFVAAHCTIDHWQSWLWSTNPPHNFKQVVTYFTERPLAEAPDLVEQLHLRSYAGDRYGFGAGVYDCSTDVFWPYADKTSWSTFARFVQDVRRSTTDAAYECAPPDERTDVCVVHLNVPFYHDTLEEARELNARVRGYLAWREADDFECTNAAHELTGGAAAKLAAALHERIAPNAPPETPFLGRKWGVVTNVDALQEDRLVRDAALEAKIASLFGVVHSEPQTLAREDVAGVDLTEDSYVEVGGERWMPVHEPPMCPRVVLTDAEWNDLGCAAADVGPRSYVVHRAEPAAPRYFRVDAGCTWRDCVTPELDHIFHCQKFTAHDRFMIYALLGRLFFKVGERDNFEMTLFFEGIAGSGKSTILKAMQEFWPPHLRAVLSSNMQPQFGMSSLAHAAICICSEVSQDLNLPQEEWQSAVSGEWVNLAVKHESPIVLKWTSQFLFAGNQFPKVWNNGQGQVSRRLAGVGLYHPVKPRDGRIAALIQQGAAVLQRKCVLAYAEFLRIHSTIDPMSQPKLLPPAFCDYYLKGRRNSDNMEGFLSDGAYVKVEEGAHMLLSDVRALYDVYRAKEGVSGSIKWGEDLYRTPFAAF